MVIFHCYVSSPEGTHSCAFLMFGTPGASLISGPFCHNEEHLTDPTTAERPPKGVRSGYRKSVNQATVVGFEFRHVWGDEWGAVIQYPLVI